MNLEVSDCYKQAIYTNPILGGSEELAIVTQKSKEALDHWLIPFSTWGSFISGQVVEDPLSMAELANKMFPDYKELTREESKEHSEAFLSFFD